MKISYDHLISALGYPSAVVLEQISGGNSTVLKCEVAFNNYIAIKIYKGGKERISQMLQRENEAIAFLSKNNLSRIPKLLSVKEEYGVTVFEWIKGINPIPSIEVMSEVLKMNRDLKNIYDSDKTFYNAIDSIDSYLEITNQIKNRLNLLFEYDRVVAIKWLITEITVRLSQHESLLNNDNHFSLHTYSLSDFGTHNLLSYEHQLTFIDFEFFGKDSFYKLIGDFILHPKNEFNPLCMDLFFNTSLVDFHFDTEVLRALLPLLSLKWAMITSNRIIRQKIANKENITVEDLMNTTGYNYLKFHDELMRNPDLCLQSTFVSYQKNMPS